MKKFLIFLAVLAVIVVAGLVFSSRPAPRALSDADRLALAAENGTYAIDGAPVTLVDGSSSVPAAPGSASLVVTRYFGNAAYGDFNADGATDTAFFLAQSDGGSGTFYYLAAMPAGASGTNAVLLGDRIAPQSISIENGIIAANYADRLPDQPMSAAPSVGVSRYFAVTDGVLAATSAPAMR